MTIEKRREKAKELYEKGLTPYEIRDVMGVGLSTVYTYLYISGITLRETTGIDESKLIYADNRKPILQKMIIEGKNYTDITPLFSPR